MTEEIIKCKYFVKEYEDFTNVCELGVIGKDGSFMACEYNPYCYYKQLKRLEQEKNKYYQQTLDDEIQINNLLEEIQQIKQDRNVENITRLSLENKRLEQENKELKEYKKEHKYSNAEYRQERESVIQLSYYRNKYRSALEEIKKVIKSYDLTVDNGASVDTLYTI